VWSCYRNGLTLQDTFEQPAEKIAAQWIKNNEAVKSDIVWVGADCGSIALRALGAKCTFAVPGKGGTVDAALIDKPADVDRLRIEALENSPEIANLLETAKIVAEKIGDEVLVGVSQWGAFTMTGLMMGMEKMRLASLEDKPGLRHVLEFSQQLLLKYWQLFIDAGVELVNQADPIASGDVVSAEIFAELALPYIKAANQAVDGKVGAKMLHICGDTTGVLDLIPSSEADLFSLDYKVDLKTARQKLGGRIAFGGQLKPLGVLLNGRPEEVEAAARACLQDAGKSGYVLMPGCDVAPATKIENVQAMIKTAHQL
jgi:uroporphyrinogen decarboxylase